MKRLLFLLLTFLCLSIKAQDGDLKILAINDMHGAVQNFPRLAYIVDSIRAQYPDLLLFSAGDNRTGNPINDMYTEPNLPMVEMMNALGFNASTMGNHECDGGMASFVNTINKSAFPYLVANAHPKDSLKLHFQPFKIFENGNLRVGVLGLVQVDEQTMMPTAHPDRMRGIRFTRPQDEARKYEWLRQQCDVMIGLTHLGLNQDSVMAREFPMFDLMICGHSHHLISGESFNGVMLAQAKRDVRYINEIDIKVRDGKVVEKTCRTHDIMKAAGVSQKLQAMYEHFSNNPVLQRQLTSAINPFSRKEELGIMMTDAYLSEFDVDIAVMNSGGVRYETKEAGPIIVNDILRLDPFNNNICIAEMDGNELAVFLAEIPGHDEYGPAYVSGISYSITMDKKKNYQVKVMTEDGKKLNMQKTYRVATNSYVAKLSKVIALERWTNTFRISSDVIIDYLSKQPAVDFSGKSLLNIGKLDYRQ